MKKIKNISLMLIIISIALLMTGCGNKNVKGDLSSLMEKVYAKVADDEKPMMLETKEVTSENVEYFLGTKDIEYKEALASESGIGSYAHSVVLVRTKENADVEEIKEKILKNVNPRKWICVGVEKDELVVKNKGDLIILIIEEDEKVREKLEKGFDAL